MGWLPSNTVPNPWEDLKAITTQSGVTLAGPSVFPPPSKEVDQEPEMITDQVIIGSTKNVPPSIVQPSPASTSSTPLSFPKMPEVTKDTIQPTMTLVNENCSAIILKKLLEKLGDPDKFLIPCDFSELDECLALAYMGAIINLMPLSIWRKLSLPELTSTQMILELADRSTTRPVGIAEDVFVKVGKFHFPTDFVFVDYVVDPRTPLILGRPFLRTGRALIDVYGEELTLCVDDEATTFKVGQTSKYFYNDAESINQIDVIDVACEEYVQEVLGFFDHSKSGKGDILYLEKLLNEDPYPNLPPVKTEDLKQVDDTMTKPSIKEPLEFKLKELPSHLEYTFLEGTDKLPVIISKELKDEEKSAHLKVLKSHKRAFAWKISNIKGIDPCFCTHKILMEDDIKPMVQHQRRVNPKIHEVIKKEVIKLFDAKLIYHISDSSWVRPVHYVPKKGGMTVVENEDNELIPTRLVTGWRVCIEYRKLNDATWKDNFPLPFMDQMLERLAENKFHFFLDGFCGYFQIPIDPQDQEKTTFTCPYGTFAYRHMPFGLCNAPGTFQMCMMAIFYDMIEKMMKCMRTRSSSNLPGESSPNPTSSNPKRRNRRRLKQPFILEESLVDTMADQCTMAELLRAPTEGYAEAIVVPPILVEQFELKHSLINMMTSDQFFGLEKDNPHDHIPILKQFQATLHPASVKSVEEICATCGGAHPYYQCLAVDGNTFLEFRDNIQGYFSAAAVNYNQGNSGHRTPVVPLSVLEKIKKMNEINMKAMQTQINNVKNELRNEMKTSIQASMSNQTNELKNMMASFFQMNIASTLGSRPLPSNTIANPKGELKAITTQSGIVIDGLSVPMPPPFINPNEDEREEETLTDPELAEDPLHPNIPYPLRMHKQQQQEKDEVQIHKFWQIFKQLHINITLADALILILRYQKMRKALLSNKEKLLELANTPLNENCSAVILKKLPEKLGDPGKFLIPCGFSEMKCKALTDLEVKDDIFDPEGGNVLIEKLLNLDSTKDLPPHHNINPLSGSTTSSSSSNHLLEEFADELVLITFPLRNEDLSFDIESDLKDIEYLLNHDPIKEMDSILEDSIDETNLAEPNDNLDDTIPEMFTDEHALDYSSPLIYEEYDDDFFKLESETDDAYNDLFDSKEEKINESKLLIDELDLPRSSDFLPLPMNRSKNIVQAIPDKNVEKISNASLILEDFDPPLYELPFHKEVPGSKTLLSFSSENEEKVFKPRILTSKGVHSSLLLELSHQGPKAFKVIKILEIPMEIFSCSFREDIRILDVPCLHFYPL
nr:DNA-directed DNA polymerase [Tanacetum cinerariifolium]